MKLEITNVLYSTGSDLYGSDYCSDPGLETWKKSAFSLDTSTSNPYCRAKLNCKPHSESL